MAWKKPNWLAVFMLCSSLTLLYFGIPRFLAELMLVPGTPIIEALNRGEKVSDEDLAIAIETRIEAVRFVDHPKAYAELGTAYLSKSMQETDPDNRRDALLTAIEHLEKGLSLQYLHTFSWLRLSTAHMMLGSEENLLKAHEAWRNSVKTAPFEPFIIIQRIHSGILLSNFNTEEDNTLLREQVALAYRWNKQKLRSYARQHDLVDWMVYLLNTDEEAVAYLEK